MNHRKQTCSFDLQINFMKGQTIFTITAKTISGVFYLAILLGCIATGVSTFNPVNGAKNVTDPEKRVA